MEALLNGVRVHAASAGGALARRPAELSFGILSEHALPELTGAQVYLRVRTQAATLLRRRVQVDHQCTGHRPP